MNQKTSSIDFLDYGIFFFIALDTLLLLFFGKSYSKYLFIKPFFYIHDILILLLSITALISTKYSKNRIKSIDLLIILAGIYLIFSFFNVQLNSSLKIYFVLRQFMLFGYIIMYYLIFKKLCFNHTMPINLYYFLIIVAFLSLTTQVFYVGYLSIFKNINPFFKKNYFSPIILLSLSMCASYVLVFIKNSYKQLVFLSILIISFTTGHDSAYLSILAVYLSYYFFQGNIRQKWFLITSLLVFGLGFFIFVPTFSDLNAQWRLVYWGAAIKHIIIDNYGVLGNGFGVPFLNQETINKLNELMIHANAPQIVFKNHDNFLTAPHNSFISIIFHTGIPAIMLLFYPLNSVIKNITKNKKIFVLFLSLVGFTTLSSFNVILELPHSSSLYWMVFFLLILMGKTQKNSQDVIK